MKKEHIPYLYILMRNDLGSLNPGKACAQATHAANQAVYQAHQKKDPKLHAMLKAWEDSTGKGFGTCIVLGVSYSDIKTTITKLVEDGFHAGITHDPTYPLLDGQTMHFLPLDTCAYVFGAKASLETYLSRYPLMA